MGRTSDEEGESSTKIYKSDDVDDRPLKKARYVWQIKGKYHLKKADEEKHPCYSSKSMAKDHCSSAVALCKTDLNISEENESHLCQHVTTTDDLNSDNGDKTEVCEVVDEENRCNSEIDKHEPESPVANKTAWSVSPSAVFADEQPSTNWQLRKWQARQVARCFVDNTINRVLEDMGFVPLPVDANDILEEFPMTESENDDGLEDEAVLMAIHRHGLRTEGEKGESVSESVSGSESAKNSSDDLKTCSDIGSATNMPCACSLRARPVLNAFENLDPFHQRPVCQGVFWDQTELDAHKVLQPSLANELKGNELIHHWFGDGGLFSSVISSDSSCDSDVKSCDESIIEERASRKDMYTVKCEPAMEKGNVTNAEVSISQEKSDDSSTPCFEHNDFLDKAVAVAIKKKGLSKLSCADYG